VEHVVAERNLARNTQLSYRDALALLMPFASVQQRQPIDRLTIEQLSPELIKAFLAHLEQTRGCSIATAISA
jgi:site-specific recombinase XerD